jgi:primosomal protein N'
MMKPAYVRVVIDRAIHRELDYLVPETLAERVGVGSRVRVPFRDKTGLSPSSSKAKQKASGRSKQSWVKRLS